MSTDRPVATDALATLGMIIDDTQKRDAIHLAVLPMQAVTKLFPGQDVGLVPGGAGPSVTPLGIVDPFLKAPVQAGERFWLILYPRTISSLRHVWSHPAVDDEPAQKPIDTGSLADRKAASEAWLRDFASTADTPGYERLIAEAVNPKDGWGDPEYLHFNGSDAHGEIPAAFWDHVEVVTGQKIEKRAKYFSCSC